MADITLDYCQKVFFGAGLVVPGVVACMGIIGTILSLMVLPRMRYFIGRIESFLLISLSVADLLVLTLQAFRILVYENNFTTFAATSETGHRILRRILIMFYCIETWIIVLIATNRFIALCFPFYRGMLSTPTAAKVSVAVVILVSVGINAVDFTTLDTAFDSRNPPWMTKPSTKPWQGQPTESSMTMRYDGAVAPSINLTTPMPKWSTTNKWGSWGGSGALGSNRTSIWQEPWYLNYILAVDRLLLAFIPCLIVLVLDIAMVSVLLKMQRTRTHLTMEKGSSGNTTAIAILLSVAISYVCINLPHHAFVIHTWYVEKSGDPCKFVKVSLNLSMVVNCSINFILYFLLSSTFRKTLRQAFKDCGKCKCRRLNISREDEEGPNKVPLIFFSKNGPTKSTDPDKAPELQEENGPIYRPVPKPRGKKAKNTNSNSSGYTASPPTSALILTNNEEV